MPAEFTLIIGLISLCIGVYLIITGNNEQGNDKFVGYGVMLIIAGLCGLLGGVMSLKEKRKRSETLRKASSHLGMKFIEEDKSLEKKAFFKFPLFKSSGNIRNIFRGSIEDCDVLLFDHSRASAVEHHGDICQTVAAFRIPSSNIPEFGMYPKKGIHRFSGKSFKVQVTNFKSYSQFLKNYIIEGKQEHRIQELFDSEILRFFDLEEGWSIEGGAEWLVVYKEGKLFGSGDLFLFLTETKPILRLFSRSSLRSNLLL